MNKKSISQIKEAFEQANAVQLESLYEIYGSDERSGVQKLIRTYRKKEEALEKERTRLEAMRSFEHAWKRCAVLSTGTAINMAVHTA